jgi:hypothetical protein
MKRTHLKRERKWKSLGQRRLFIYRKVGTKRGTNEARYQYSTATNIFKNYYILLMRIS